MLTCFAVRHQADNAIVRTADHNILRAIADEASVRFEPGWVEMSYLEMPRDEMTRQAVEERLRQNQLAFDVVTRIAY
ncbi:hypothetical protein [Caballeronia sp. S22]|uniref:hypothetical protein n=1 Tax=Caballeronia sp. S22 TaxID=3137182 RepID=UPI00353089C3